MKGFKRTPSSISETAERRELPNQRGKEGNGD
jgi:hypothetical protein